jgi:hypothetical protein
MVIVDIPAFLLSSPRNDYTFHGTGAIMTEELSSEESAALSCIYRTIPGGLLSTKKTPSKESEIRRASLLSIAADEYGMRTRRIRYYDVLKLSNDCQPPFFVAGTS